MFEGISTFFSWLTDILATSVVNSLGYGQSTPTKAPKTVHLKKWETRLDSKVRPAHKEAEGQIVSESGYFNIGGYKAICPGDPKLPAALRKNCRCRAVEISLSENQVIQMGLANLLHPTVTAGDLWDESAGDQRQEQYPFI